MNSFYQLIDLTSGNVIDDFDTQTEALAWINTIAKEHGEDELLTLSLFHINGEQQTLIALEQKLLELANKEDLKMTTSTNA